MRNNQILELTGEKFRRLTGVKRATFEKMVEILHEA
ncbi:MAG: IS5/IS1182 family transposase, partial [Rickettsia sp.]|nr:IS5/IS1182 family transposase [Rickettsia sp.]